MQYLIMSIGEGCDPVNKLYYCDLSSLSGGLESFRGSSTFLPFTKLIDSFDAQYIVISNDETLFTFLTNKDAPKYKLVRVDLKEPNSWTDVVEEHEKDVLASACAVNGNQLVTCYMSDVKHILQIRDMKSGSLLHQLPLDIGSVSDVSARRKDDTFFFSFTSFLTPGVIYKCDLANEAPEVKVFREVAVPGFDREAFQATQVTHYLVPSSNFFIVFILFLRMLELLLVLFIGLLSQQGWNEDTNVYCGEKRYQARWIAPMFALCIWWF